MILMRNRGYGMNSYFEFDSYSISVVLEDDISVDDVDLVWTYGELIVPEEFYNKPRVTSDIIKRELLGHEYNEEAGYLLSREFNESDDFEFADTINGMCCVELIMQMFNDLM